MAPPTYFAAFGATCNATSVATSGTITPSGSNRANYHWVFWNNGSGQTISSVVGSIDGAFTLFGTAQLSTNFAGALYRFVNPGAIAGTVITTFSANVQAGTISVRTSDVDQTTPLISLAKATGTGTTVSTSNVATADQISIFGMCCIDASGGLTMSAVSGTGITSDGNVTSSTGTGGIRLRGAWGAAGATNSPSTTLNLSREWMGLSAVLNGVGAAPSLVAISSGYSILGTNR